MVFRLDEGLILLQGSYSSKPHGGKSVHALRSHMGTLDYMTEPIVTCLDIAANDVALIWATGIIGGRGTIEELLACDFYPHCLLVSGSEKFPKARPWC
jgi:hypothetical protein